jgi:hypothetical protein
MDSTKIFGLILIVGGLALAFWGYQISESAGSQLSQVFSNSMPDDVLYRYIAGAVFAGAGFFIIAKI